MTVERFVDEVSEQLAGPGRRLGRGARRQPRRGAGGDGRQPHAVGKAGYESAWAPLVATLAERAQLLKAALLRAVDDDTKAFDDVLAAMRLPKAHRGTESGASVRDRGRLREGDRRSARHGAALPAGARDSPSRPPRAETGIRLRTPASARCSPRPGSTRPS